MNRHLYKEDVQMANGHMKKMLDITIRKMQIKIIMRYHFILSRMTIIKKTNKTDAGKDVYKSELHMPLVGM